MRSWVELGIRYSKRGDLAEHLAVVLGQLDKRPVSELEASLSLGSGGQPPRDWRVTDRLTDEDICVLVDRFRAGTPKRVLAEEYGISMSSVKRLLRERGVRRNDQS